MNSTFLKSFFVLAVSLAIYACSSSKKAPTDIAGEDSLKQGQTIVPDTFLLPEIPSGITNPNVRAAYLVMHYWDRFDFANEKLTLRPEITEQAFVDYIHILSLVPFENAKESLNYTLRKAKMNRVMYTYFGSLFDKYLFDANSPFRNEEYYIPVLQDLVNSDLLSEEERSRYRFQLNMALKNRVGETASDFVYTLANGESKKMHSIKSEYLLLIFSNPGCSTCASVTETLSKSDNLAMAFSMNSPSRTMITVLTVYPDTDIDEWRSHLQHLPANWIHSYDKDRVITKQKLYDLKAIPTIYLLDREKRVILKDTSLEAIEAFFARSN
jgi:hypothetical protein